MHELEEQQLEKLVSKYELNKKLYERQSYNETELRIEFLNPLFKLLGWDVDNDQGRPAYAREVRHEASVLVDEGDAKRNKKPDYLFQLGSKKCFYLEAKKPSVDIVDQASPAFQTRRYGWSGNLGISVLSNFKDLIIYDCSLRPQEGDAPNVGRIIRFNYTEYVDRFEEIKSWLSREAVITGTFDSKVSRASIEFESEPFDKYFLEQIRSWRILISEDISSSPLVSSDEALNSYVQRILNRILFLRICEDKELERYKELKEINSSRDLLELFKKADSRYDSGLFEMVSNDEPMPSKQALMKILNDLYYPQSSYDFNVIDTFVMSQIYDLFLCEEVVRSDGKLQIVTKPDLAESEGAVCTPRNVSDLIVDKVFDRLAQDSLIRKGKSPRIADICCGSGVFLISAFERLCNDRLIELCTDVENALANGDIILDSNAYKLSFKERRNLLQDSIFGVDIDPAAVEVCRFNLLVKLLEDSNPEEIEDYTLRTGQTVLPNLDNNIVVGNSLVDGTFYSYMPEAYSDFDIINKVKPFDWDTKFPTKFDAIVGNPPYIRVQNLVQHSPEEYGYMKSSLSPYVTASEGLPDKYQLFIERALSLLTENGCLGYIVPNKFMTIQGGRTLRTLLATSKAIKEIIDFGSEQVFSGRLTYTCILILGKDSSETYELTSVKNLDSFYLQGAPSNSYPADSLSGEIWSFPDSEADAIVEALGDKVSPLKSFAKVFVGLQTSADDVYVINPEGEDDELIYFTDMAGAHRTIEKGILRNFIYKVTLQKYEPVIPNRYLLFPYTVLDNKATLIPIEVMRVDYPKAFEYLSAHKDKLLSRNCVPAQTEDTWYRYGRSQSLSKFENGTQHIIWSTLSLYAKYVLDEKDTCFTGGGNGPYYGLERLNDTRESILYILCLLNHPFVESFIKRGTSFFAGGYYSHGKQFVENLPIRRIDFSDTNEVAAHNEIVEHASNMLDLGARKVECTSPDQIEVINRSMVANEDRINQIIDKLYCL